MLNLDTVDMIVTTFDLSEHLNEELKEAGGDPKIVVSYKSGEVIMTSEGYTHGLCIGLDSFGRWVIHELISHENDGVFAQIGSSHKTEQTMTVMRAVARWMFDVVESREVVPVKYRFGIFAQKVPGT
jgi:hypothetical protein